ncbi:MAG: sigma-70 family RNA polymerase sigma factor [Acidimicrobiia bacterium]|nr:sigma-70 family RNA polymerase sigma factor [Acidimicrobiia bacterium]
MTADPDPPPAESTSDAALVIAVARGRQEALAALWRRHGGVVHGLARRLLRRDDLAEDVSQEVFLSLWRHPERFDPQRGSLRTFLLTTCHRRAVDVIRAEEARRNRELREQLQAPVPTVELEQAFADAAVAELVRHALGQLPVEERRAIELAYWGGHTYQEVARLLEQPEGTVKSRIRAGMRRLRELMATADSEGVAT